MVLTFGAAYSAQEKSCAKEEKDEVKRYDIDKLNIFIVAKFPDITNNLGPKYKFPAALYNTLKKSKKVIFITSLCECINNVL